MEIVKTEVNVDKGDAENFFERKLSQEGINALAQDIIDRYWGSEWFEPEFFDGQGDEN